MNHYVCNFELKFDLIFFFYRLGEQTNSELKMILIGQILTTIPNIGMCVYVLSLHEGKFDLEFVEYFLSFESSALQLFLYCWYGNKLILQVQKPIT